MILIGEMRDEETVHTALSAAETGHLVFSTVHTVDAAETVNRLIDFFPPHMHQQVRAMLAGTLKGVISQRLVPTADGGGRVAACEILRMTGRVRDMIMDPEQTGQLPRSSPRARYYGMQTFDQALFEHLKAGRVTMEEAVPAASSPHDFKLLVAADGKQRHDDGRRRRRREPAHAGRLAGSPPDRTPAACRRRQSAGHAASRPTLQQFNETTSHRRLRAPELQAAEGAARRGRRSRPSRARWSPTRAT